MKKTKVTVIKLPKYETTPRGFIKILPGVYVCQTHKLTLADERYDDWGCQYYLECYKCEQIKAYEFRKNRILSLRKMGRHARIALDKKSQDEALSMLAALKELYGTDDYSISFKSNPFITLRKNEDEDA
jgi:hypothetical protein